MCAARKSGSYLKERFWRLKARRGPKRAAVAVAHSILVIAYEMLRRKLDYRDLGPDYLDRVAKRSTERRLIKRLEALGYKGQKPILLVVNQSDSTAGLSKGGMEHALNLPVVAEIPTDWKLVSESNNKQTPFVLANASAPVSQAMAGLATTLVTQQRK